MSIKMPARHRIVQPQNCLGKAVALSQVKFVIIQKSLYLHTNIILIKMINHQSGTWRNDLQWLTQREKNDSSGRLHGDSVKAYTTQSKTEKDKITATSLPVATMTDHDLLRNMTWCPTFWKYNKQMTFANIFFYFISDHVLLVSH
jgi:hypothetical protein